MATTKVAPEEDLRSGAVVGSGRYAVGYSRGQYFAVTRRCRHLGADLAEGSVDSEGCLVCPWHHSAYDVTTGRMVRGPQGAFAKVPGLGRALKMLTWALPLGRGTITVQDGDVYVE
jgi:nitrite reductase/ring-hydroxylating ferredoxin subunit